MSKPEVEGPDTRFLSFRDLQQLISLRKKPNHYLSTALRSRVKTELERHGLDDSFLRLISRGRGIVSGSLPLRIMFPEDFVDAPMTAYVNSSHIDHVIDRLYRMDFRLVDTLFHRESDIPPSPRTPTTPSGYCHCYEAEDVGTLLQGIAEPSFSGNALHSSSHLWHTTDDTIGCESIERIYEFRLNSLKPVQIVQTKTQCTLIPLFCAHATLAMNYITVEGMVVAYGDLTLNKSSLLNRRHDGLNYPHYHPISRYMAAGFDFVKRPHTCEVDLSCYRTIRSLYDDHTLHIPMDPTYPDEDHHKKRIWYEPQAFFWRLCTVDACWKPNFDVEGFVAGDGEMEVLSGRV